MQGIVIAALLFAPPPADDFCDGLKRIVAAAPDNFSAVAGELVSPGSDGRHGVVKLDVGGPVPPLCQVTSHIFRDGKVSHMRYWCVSFYPANDAPGDAQVAALADRVAGCFEAEARAIPDPKMAALGYPAERRITLAPFEIVVESRRMEFRTMTGWNQPPPKPYITNTNEHDYWMTIEIRPIEAPAH